MDAYRDSEKTDVISIVAIAVLHLLAITGLFLYSPNWERVILFWALFMVQGVAFTLCYHRCLTHRSFYFKYRWLERVFTTIAALGLQRGPLWWCSLHRIHHKFSDTNSDPHNSRKGFWYSHMMWIPHVDRRWRSPPKYERYRSYVEDLAKDPYYCWLDRYHYVPYLIYLVFLYFAGGWAFIFWGGFIVTVYNWHITWMINSVSHRFGYKSYETYDLSRNNILVGLLVIGEGWHNNHHAFPSSPRHGFFNWWEFDFTYIVIRLLGILGLVHNLRYPTDNLLSIVTARSSTDTIYAKTMVSK